MSHAVDRAAPLLCEPMIDVRRDRRACQAKAQEEHRPVLDVDPVKVDRLCASFGRRSAAGAESGARLLQIGCGLFAVRTLARHARIAVAPSNAGQVRGQSLAQARQEMAGLYGVADAPVLAAMAVCDLADADRFKPWFGRRGHLLEAVSGCAPRQERPVMRKVSEWDARASLFDSVEEKRSLQARDDPACWSRYGDVLP